MDKFQKDVNSAKDFLITYNDVLQCMEQALVIPRQAEARRQYEAWYIKYANTLAKAVENNEILLAQGTVGEGRILAGTKFENFKLFKLGQYFNKAIKYAGLESAKNLEDLRAGLAKLKEKM